MTDELMPDGNGWYMPPRSRKYHYFEDTRSVCGGYAFMKMPGSKDTGEYNDGDCAKCVKEMKKRKEAEKK